MKKFIIKKTICFVYISAVHFNVQLPVLTLIEAIFWESARVNPQGWITSNLQPEL